MHIDNHIESFGFQVLKKVDIPVILKLSWLQRLNPQIDWLSGVILVWSADCHRNCLGAMEAPSILDQNKTSVEKYQDLTKVPIVYHNLKGDV